MVAFSIWTIHIYRYGIMYAIGILMQLWRFSYISNSRIFYHQYIKIHTLITSHRDDLLVTLIIWMILWARIWHILIYDFWYYIAHPFQIFNLWWWGMSFVWWFLWVMLAAIIFLYRYRLRFLDGFFLWDTICALLPFNIILGRIGNFLNQELYGRIVDTSLWSDSTLTIFQKLGIIYQYGKIDTHIRRNTNLFEALWEGVIVWCITMIIRHITYKYPQKIYPWYVTGWFMIFYSIIRFMLEPLRDNPSTEYIRWYNKTQLLMLIMFFTWVVVCFYFERHRRLWSKL